MLTEHDMTSEDMQKAVANGYLCAVCQGVMSVAWGGVYKIDGYVLICGHDIEHTGITRHDKAEESKKKEYFSMDSKALQTMNEAQMVARVEMARFPQELNPADKRLLAQVAITYGFDPLMKEISIYQGNPFVSIDGRYRKAQETGKLDGVSTRPATEQERKDWGIPAGDYFFKAEVMVVGAKYPFVGWGKVFQAETQIRPGKPGDAYKPTVTNPQRMAEKRAEAQALRKAFHIPLPSIEDIGTPEEESTPTVRVIAETREEATIPPEATKAPAVVPGESDEGYGIDPDFLKEIFKKLDWTPAKAASWLENRFPPMKRKGTLEDTLRQLTKEQKGIFVQAISEMAAGK